MERSNVGAVTVSNIMHIVQIYVLSTSMNVLIYVNGLQTLKGFKFKKNVNSCVLVDIDDQ